MSFDEIPENKHNSAPCPNCENGNAVEDKQGNWSCDTCDWCFVKGDKDGLLCTTFSGYKDIERKLGAIELLKHNMIQGAS